MKTRLFFFVCNALRFVSFERNIFWAKTSGTHLCNRCDLWKISSFTICALIFFSSVHLINFFSFASTIGVFFPSISAFTTFPIRMTKYALIWWVYCIESSANLYTVRFSLFSQIFIERQAMIACMHAWHRSLNEHINFTMEK